MEDNRTWIDGSDIDAPDIGAISNWANQILGRTPYVDMPAGYEAVLQDKTLFKTLTYLKWPNPNKISVGSFTKISFEKNWKQTSTPFSVISNDVLAIDGKSEFVFNFGPLNQCSIKDLTQDIQFLFFSDVISNPKSRGALIAEALAKKTKKGQYSGNCLINKYDWPTTSQYEKDVINKKLNILTPSWKDTDSRKSLANILMSKFDYERDLLIIGLPIKDIFSDNPKKRLTGINLNLLGSDGKIADFNFGFSDINKNTIDNDLITTWDFLVPEIDNNGIWHGNVNGGFIIQIKGSIYKKIIPEVKAVAAVKATRTQKAIAKVNHQDPWMFGSYAVPIRALQSLANIKYFGAKKIIQPDITTNYNAGAAQDALSVRKEDYNTTINNAGQIITTIGGTSTAIVNGVVEETVKQDSPQEVIKALIKDYLSINFPYLQEAQIVPAGSSLSNAQILNSQVLARPIGNGQDIVLENKYNFTNILTELRYGSEYQPPFKYFKNVYIDKNYQAELIGKFRTVGQVQRIFENPDMLTKNYLVNMGKNPLNGFMEIPLGEGSNDDQRVSNDKNNTYDYNGWNNKENFDEVAGPITHVVYNSNVDSVCVTLMINSLHDSLSKTIDKATPDKTKPLDAGQVYPAIVNVRIETGLILADGSKDKPFKIYDYQITALIQSLTIIDIGSGTMDSQTSRKAYPFIKDLSTQDSDISNPLKLPPVDKYEQTNQKRYVRVTKLSTETNSTLIAKEISLGKITEIIPIDLSYPFSAICGIKIDSRSFGSIPIRTYDCKLKQVRVPNTYFPLLDSGRDKRYYKDQAEFNALDKKYKQVYASGGWNGDFKKNLEWTDNPAWILYDLLTNTRYGLGQYIDPAQIDIWELYKIGKFCDAVDEDGYFVGVPDGAGGLEPRFSCNIMFSENMKIFDAINTIAALFRGAVYFCNSEIRFTDDRPKKPVALFTNSNVKDGFFSYSNYKRDEQFNSIEVVYIDRFDNFLTKMEYVEDEEDIRKRGVFKKTINANGVSSRAMARRIGKHIIFQTIKENQSLSFAAGLESLLCRPGDLIIIEDELKSLRSNFGRILDVDLNKKSIRVNEVFDSNSYNPKITVYTPTGVISKAYLDSIAETRRIQDNDIVINDTAQITTFNITGFTSNLEYGSEALIDQNSLNASLLPYVKLGSVFRYQRKNVDEQVFKIVKIQEENQNEYNIIATAFDSGKYNYIENNKSIEYAENTFSYKLPQIINEKTFGHLMPPSGLYVTTGATTSGTLYFSGYWNKEPNALEYNVSLQTPNGSIIDEIVPSTGSSSTFNTIFNTNSAIGNYLFKVNSRGKTTNTAIYNDSDYSQSGFFIMFENSPTIQNEIVYSRTFINQIKLIE